jgi:hypothetical protein
MKRSVTREWEEVMSMAREVILHQYEQSPNTIAYFRSQGVGSRIDPLLRLTEICTPDSLDHVCSIFEAYRKMTFHVKKQGECLPFIISLTKGECWPSTISRKLAPFRSCRPCLCVEDLRVHCAWHTMCKVLHTTYVGVRHAYDDTSTDCTLQTQQDRSSTSLAFRT